MVFTAVAAGCTIGKDVYRFTGSYKNSLWNIILCTSSFIRFPYKGSFNNLVLICSKACLWAGIGLNALARGVSYPLYTIEVMTCG
jgi:hypothetical protein